MKTANTAVTTMIIALAMIGMTGFAMAGSTEANFFGDGSYDMNFDGMGTGSMDVYTHTSTGFDHMSTGWTNTNMGGHQNMDMHYYSNGVSTSIVRGVTVGTGGTGQDASGYIQTYTDDGGNNSVSSMATYHDDKAYDSNVHTTQEIWTCEHDNVVDWGSKVFGQTEISGFAYGNDTLVTGAVGEQSGNMSTFAGMEMTQGAFDLDTRPMTFSKYGRTGDPGTHAKLDIRNMAGTGAGNATIAGISAIPSLTDFSFVLDGSDDSFDYHVDTTADDLTEMSFRGNFNDSYTGIGHIYVVNPSD